MHGAYLHYHAKIVSIRAPRVGSDVDICRTFDQQVRFQSALPVWGAIPIFGLSLLIFWEFQSALPVWGAMSRPGSIIPLGQFQSALPVWGAMPWHRRRQDAVSSFNPRSPCGERSQ